MSETATVTEESTVLSATNCEAVERQCLKIANDTQYPDILRKRARDVAKKLTEVRFALAKIALAEIDI